MELQPLQMYQNKETGDLVRLFSVARKRRNGAHVIVYQDSNMEDWVESLENFKEKFQHKPVDHSNCVAPGCEQPRIRYDYYYCKDHG